MTDAGDTFDLGDTEATPTIGITDYSRRVTDDFGVTTVVPRGFSRKLSVRLGLPFDGVDVLQQRLAALRATPALWVADDRYASLSVRGFYKDFDIDLAIPPLSTCTLTVEGLAETDTATDPGGDPAPDGQTSTLQLLQPLDVGAGVFAASNVPENDAPEWVASTTYAKAARVIKTATHRLYESVGDGNVGNDPAGTSGQWLDLGPTNRWSMFDQALGTATSAPDPIIITLDASAATAIALLDVTGSLVRVQRTGYDRTVAVGAGAITFLDLPANAGMITVTIRGTGAVSVGTLLIGGVVSLGVTEASPTAGITDFSRKDVDDFGEVTIVERAWAKRMTAKALIRTDAIDAVFNRIASVRSVPSLWLGQAGVDSLTVYGFFKDFSIEVDQGVSKLSLSIEGLSKAAKLAPLGTSVGWPDVTDPLGTKPTDNADVTGDNVSKDTNAVAGKPASEVADAVSAADGSTILTRDVKAALLVATSAIASATAAIAAAQDDIVAAQGLIDTIHAQATAAQGRADEAIVQVGAAAADATNAKASAAAAQSRADQAVSQVGVVATDASAAKAAAAAAQSRADQAVSDITAAGGDIVTLKTLTATQGAQISSNATAITNAVGNLATLTTRVSAGSPNLAPNPSFADGLKNWNQSAGAWTYSQGGVWGNYAALVLPSAANGGFYYIDSDLFIFANNAPFTATADADVHGSGSYAQVQVLFFDSDRKYIDFVAGAGVGPLSFGTDAQYNRGALKVQGATPANCTYCMVRLVAPAGVQNAAFRRVKFEYGATMTSFTDEASVATTYKALSTLDTQYASLSTTIGVQGASITQNASALSSLGTTVANLSSSVSSQGANITTNANAISAVGTNVANLTSTVSSQGTSITNNASAISSLGSTIATLSSTVSTQGSQIATNATAITNAAGNLATLSQRVAAGSPNLAPNPSFADGLKNWNQSAGAWTYSQGGVWGNYAALVLPSAANGGFYYIDSDLFVFANNAPFTATADADVHGSGSYAQVQVLFFDSDRKYIDFVAGAGVGPLSFGTDAQYNRGALKVQATTPANCTYCMVRLVAPAGVQNATFRRVKFEYGATMTSFTDEASVATTYKALSTLDTQYASLSTTIGVQGASITQNASALSSLGTTVANLSSSVSSQGANITTNANAISAVGTNVANLTSTVSSQGTSITNNASAISSLGSTVATLSSTVSTQGSQIATNATAISNAAGNLAMLSQRVAAGSPNLAPNPSFADGLKNWNQSAGAWTYSQGGVWGNYATLVLPSATNGGFYYIDSDLFVFANNAPFTATADADVHGNGSYAQVQVLFFDSNRKYIDFVAGAGVGPLSFGTDAQFNRGALKVQATTPANCTFCQIRLVAPAGVQNAAFRRVKFEYGSIMTSFTDEASVTTTYKALSTLDTQYASLSSIVSTQGASVTQNANTISSLGTNVANLSSTVSAQGTTVSQNASAISSLNSSLGSLSSVVSSQGAQISSNATALSTVNSNLATLTASLSAGNPNLARNPTFANGFADWAARNGNWSASVGTGQWGSYGFLDCGAYPGLPGGGNIYYLDAAPIAFEGGAPFTASCDADAHAYDGNTASAHIEMIFLDGNSVEINGTRQYGAAVSNPWFGNPPGQNRAALRLSGVTPAGTVSVVFRFVVTGTDRISGAALRQVKVERGSLLTPFSNEASIVQSYQAISNLNQSFASLSSTVSTQGASITQNANALSSLGGNYASLSSTVSAQGTSISQNAQAISDTNGRVADLTNTVSSQGVSISQSFQAISGVQGSVNQALGRVALRIGVNGKVVGWEIANNGQTGDMNVDVDHFVVGDQKIFQVDTNTGIVSADNLLVRRVRAASIETDALVDHSVTGFTAIDGWSGSVDSGAAPAYSDALTIPTQGGVVRVDVSFDASITNGTGIQFYGQLLRDGSAISRQFRLNVSAAASGVPLFFTIVDSPPAGTHTYTMVFGRTAAGSSVLNIGNGQTYAQEFKK